MTSFQSWTRSTGLLAVALFAGNAGATPAADAWLAWLGCWQPEGGAAEQMLCIVPEGAGVRMLTVSGGSVQSESKIIADNQARAISQEGCAGTERAIWSNDQRRVFLHADQTCGERMQRKVTGLLTLVTSSELLSVQSVTSGENTGVRTVRYRAVESGSLPAEVTLALRDNRLARQTARQAVAGVIELRDVTEAVSSVHHLVVESWLTEADQKFDLNGRTLIALADAGVPATVIDVLVAVSNPKLFAVRDRDERATDNDRRGRGGYGGSSCYDDMGARWFDPFGYNFGYRSNRTNRYLGYGYDQCRGYGVGGNFGYSPWGYDGYGWRYNTPIIVVRGEEEENPDRKVTKRGYSSGRDSTEGTSTPKSGTSSSVGTTKTSSGSGSTGSSSGSTTTRTAKPRGGN